MYPISYLHNSILRKLATGLWQESGIDGGKARQREGEFKILTYTFSIKMKGIPHLTIIPKRKNKT
jgi:hypothetical protein